jgi:L-Ala-D/L-Glu epimerase
MDRELTLRAERLPLRAPFRISRGVKTHAEVVVVELADGGVRGRGECVPYARYGETTESVTAELAPLVQRFRAGEPAAELVATLPAGAARNALDCAAWDLQARRSGRSVAERLGRTLPASLASAITISLDAPAAMAAAAAAVADAPLLKVKLGAEDAAARLTAVAEAAPAARLILDPNESWISWPPWPRWSSGCPWPCWSSRCQPRTTWRWRASPTPRRSAPTNPSTPPRTWKPCSAATRWPTSSSTRPAA